MNSNVFLICTSLLTLSIGGYFVLEKNKTIKTDINTSSIPEKIIIKKIVIPQSSIEFSFTKNMKNEYIFSGIFAKEDTPRKLIQSLNLEKLDHDITINSGLEYDKNIIILSKKLFKELVNNYIEGAVIYKQRKLLVKGKVKEKKYLEEVNNFLSYSPINSFNATDIYIEKSNSVTLNDETADIISNLVKTVDNGEKRIEELIKPKVIVKEKVVVKEIVKVKEKIVVKYKEPKVKIKEKVIVKYVYVPKEDKTSKITKDEYLKKLHNKAPDKSIMSLPSVELIDMDIENKIGKGIVKPLRTKKPLVEKGTIYLPSTKNKIDKNIPWANLHNMNDKLDGIVYDDVIASPTD